MGLPIATTKGGICFAFPDVCMTPIGTSDVPVPYPNIGLLSEAKDVSDEEGKTVRVAGHYVILHTSKIENTKGDEAGTKGVKSKTDVGGEVTFKIENNGSETVKINGVSVIRMTDKTLQNNGNANGIVLGGIPNVRCG